MLEFHILTWIPNIGFIIESTISKEEYRMTEDNAQLNNQEKPASPKEREKENDRLFWISLGVILFIGIGIIGYLLFNRSRNTKNTPPPVIEPTTSSNVTIKDNYIPKFEVTSCDFAIPIQARVTCGFVVLPEDRKGDLTDTVQIAVVIYHSNSDIPEPDPILYIQGGPGAPAIDWSTGIFETVIVPLLNDRDFIVFDQRGVGYSKPRLDCDEIKSTYLSDIQGKFPEGQAVSYYEGALITCRTNFTNSGVNLPTYISENFAADTVDIIKALGYGQANLYGASYGTRIAQLIMRANPDAVRSVILDSVVPVESQLLKQDVNAEIDRVIQLLFEDCNSHPACLSAYPDLESGYNEILDKLDAQPIEVTVTLDKNRVMKQKLNSAWFRNMVAWGFRNPLTLAAIPQLIDRTLDGDYSLLHYAAALPLITFDSISMGIYVSVNCHDQVFAIPTEGLDETIYDLCNIWGVASPVPGGNDPVVSDIPTLIFAGKYDTVTPTTFASQLASHLSNSHVVEIQNQGHTPSLSGISDCPIEIISEFLQNPKQSPNIACADETRGIDFTVPYSIDDPIALEPTVIDLYRINSLIPTDWSKAEFGFYNRNNLFGDITQVGIQRAAVPEAEWANWLVSNYAGTRGFDGPAIRDDQRRVNGLSWNLYKTSSQGNPIDLAFAKSGNETFMILLISYENEHNALYQTVFLPIIDSVTSSE
jgi:pimeloyl-ACP methyl ester carboxylesterase